LTARDRRQLRHDVPATAKAYEYYLRANQLSQDASAWSVARDLYLQSVEEDPRYAPAWARLARVYRLLGKYRKEEGDHGLARAEEALQRALALNPDLPLAHPLYAQIEVDRGRAEDAMVRLLGRAQDHAAVPEIFAGLVHACRYCGLLDASVAAHVRAVRLDPTIETSVMHTYWALRQYDDVIAASKGVQAYVFVMSIAELGRSGEALQRIGMLEASGNRVPALVAAARALLEGRGADAVGTLEKFASTVGAIDPEALFYAARHLAHVGRPDLAMPMIRRVIAGGFCPAMAGDSWLDSLRDRPEFREMMAEARARREHADERFVSMGGPALLGLS
jgi:tetratricopeptide (TPR) repeat protein